MKYPFHSAQIQRNAELWKEMITKTLDDEEEDTAMDVIEEESTPLATVTVREVAPEPKPEDIGEIGTPRGGPRRHVLFSKEQLAALEKWYEVNARPTQEEMEAMVEIVNAPLLRDTTKHPTSFTLLQIRRWLYKRRGQDKALYKKLETELVTGQEGVVPSSNQEVCFSTPTLIPASSSLSHNSLSSLRLSSPPIMKNLSNIQLLTPSMSSSDHAAKTKKCASPVAAFPVDPLRNITSNNQ